MIKAYLIHLSYNMFGEDDPSKYNKKEHAFYQPYLRFDKSLWNELLIKMVDAGMNMVIIDLGDAVKYESHPEIAVKGAWSVKKLKEELKRIRKLGIEPIPKLNFSTTHDAWLGKYSRMVSTKEYYHVCKDLIKEAIAIFDKPRFFHIGMDEEEYEYVKNRKYVLIRQNELWWNDLYFYVDIVEKQGSRAWIWSDYLWHHKKEFFKKMPKSVLQSNWYYDVFTKKGNKWYYVIKEFQELDRHGYDQVPTGSNWAYPDNYANLVKYCEKHISAKHLLGFMQTSWRPTIKSCRKYHLEAINVVHEKPHEPMKEE